MAKDKGNTRSGDKPKTKDKTKQSAAAATSSDAPLYPLGPQSDGSIVLRVASDFDLMVLRKACEKQKKNATAATGTVSALADGEDPFIDAVERCLDRLLNAINRARAPENQIKGTPIGDAINEAGSESSDDGRDGRTDGGVESSNDIETHHGGTRRWAEAIPRPRPKAGDVVQFPDDTVATIVDALGFKGDNLTGSESSDELQKLADEGKLTGAFELIVADRDTNVFVRQQPLHHDSSVTYETWRLVGHDEKYAEIDAREVGTSSPSSTGDANNIATSVTDVVESAKGKSKPAAAKPPAAKSTKRKR